MPTLARFGNIKIQMFADDHAPVHFHVRTPTSKAVVTLADLSCPRQAQPLRNPLGDNLGGGQSGVSAGCLERAQTKVT